MLYFIRAVGTKFVKIGFTNSGGEAQSRLSSLQVGCPHELRVEAHCQGGLQDEHRMHAALASKRVRGEWFCLTEKEVRDLAKCPPQPQGPGEEPEPPGDWVDEVATTVFDMLSKERDDITIASGRERAVLEALRLQIVGRLSGFLKEHAQRVDFFLMLHESWEQKFAVWAAWQKAYGDGITRECRCFRRRANGSGVEPVPEHEPTLRSSDPDDLFRNNAGEDIGM